jgi:hypothetical protein
MILLIFCVGLFSTVESARIDCEFENDPAYRLLEYYYLKVRRAPYVCGFRIDADERDLNLNLTIEYTKNRTNQHVQALIFKTTAIPILPKEIFAKFPNITSSYFYRLNNSSATEVHQDWFKHARNFTELVFYESNIPTLEPYVFTNLQNLIRLDFVRCGIKIIDEAAFVGLKKLEELKLLENNFTHLHSDTFNDLVSLKEIYMEFNPIQKLGTGVFRNLVKLEVLRMQGSQLESLSEGLFESNLNLKEIELQGAKLSRIPRTLFSHMKNLTSLYLKDNYCVTEWFRGINDGPVNLQFVEDGLINCSCDLAEEYDPFGKLKIFMIYFGGISGIVLLTFICHLRYSQARKDTPSTDNRSRKWDGKMFSEVAAHFKNILSVCSNRDDLRRLHEEF